MAEETSLAQEVDGLASDFADMCSTLKQAVLMTEKTAQQNRLLKAQVAVVMGWLNSHPFCPDDARCKDHNSCEECYLALSREEAERMCDAETKNNG